MVALNLSISLHISPMRACRLSYSTVSSMVMPRKVAFSKAANCCLESAESSAERSFVNSATSPRPQTVVWKVRKVQRNGPLSIRPRCLCFPAIDRRQLDRGGEVRKLQSIIGSSSHEISTCQTSSGFHRTNFLQSQTTNLGVSSEKELRAYSTVVAATQCFLRVPLTRG